VDDPYFAGWRTIQAKHMETIISSFPDIPILPLRLFDEEMVGVERLRRLAGELYGVRDPVRGFSATSPFTVEEQDNEVTLSMAAPFVDRGDLEVLRHGDELYVTVGPYRRSFVLPDSLRRRQVSRARLEEGSLRVTFAETGS
jgi:arsenite/tail-anchored protein-transporting ATPase